jgi:hypothetical protein
MEDLWGNLTDEIPDYFKDIAKDFSLKFIKISRTKTALVNERFALVISIDRFSADVDYIMRDENGGLLSYNCGNFFAEKYDASDRKNLIIGNTAKERIINDLIIINNGLKSKWSMVLNGNVEWIEDFKKSIWFSRTKLGEAETKILVEIII